MPSLDKALYEDGQLFFRDSHNHRIKASIRTCAWCGESFLAILDSVKKRRGNYCSRSCRAKGQNRGKTHPMWKHGHCAGGVSSTYRAWLDMKHRCHHPSYLNYKYYGGKGVRVCKEWKDDFEAFLKDMGIRPRGLTLERINRGKNYSPMNCRWATMREQNRNKSNNYMITHDGRTACLEDWSRITGLNRYCIRNRLNNMGWSPKEALTLAPNSTPRYRK
jgi:hypothetical protein